MGRSGLGVVLVIAGLAVFLGNMGYFNDDTVVLTAVAAAFIVAYFVQQRRRVGFLVAGSVIGAVALSNTLDRWLHSGDNDYLFFLSLALAFAVVYLVELGVGHNRTWSLYTALGLAAFATFLFLVQSNARFVRQLSAWWPLVLVGLGVWLLLGGSRRKPESD